MQDDGEAARDLPSSFRPWLDTHRAALLVSPAAPRGARVGPQASGPSLLSYPSRRSMEGPPTGCKQPLPGERAENASYARRGNAASGPFRVGRDRRRDRCPLARCSMRYLGSCRRPAAPCAGSQSSCDGVLFCRLLRTFASRSRESSRSCFEYVRTSDASSRSSSSAFRSISRCVSGILVR